MKPLEAQTSDFHLSSTLHTARFDQDPASQHLSLQPCSSPAAGAELEKGDLGCGTVAALGASPWPPASPGGRKQVPGVGTQQGVQSPNVWEEVRLRPLCQTFQGWAPSIICVGGRKWSWEGQISPLPHRKGEYFNRPGPPFPQILWAQVNPWRLWETHLLGPHIDR